MPFPSILFDRDYDGVTETAEAPVFFPDLNLEQIIDGLTAARAEYNLKPLFYTPLRDLDAIRYRHEVFRDLEDAALFRRINGFANKMRDMREHLATSAKLHYHKQKQSWFLHAVQIYNDAVTSLAHDLNLSDPQSQGLLAFREYLAGYVKSDSFISLQAQTQQLKADLASVKYCLLIKGDLIRVRKYDSEPDYSIEVEQTFEKFKQGAVKDYRVEFINAPDMNHVEAAVLDLVAKLHPETFLALERYCEKNAIYLDPIVGAFDREVQLYTSYLEYISILKTKGLRFCYPEVSDSRKDICNYDGFDLALAHKLVREKASIVCNDFAMQGGERVFVVSGPNQGGKTTFARSFGQLHYLACLGCPVPGREARLFLFDRLFTHFEKEEKVETLRGKLEDDLIRIHDILSQATPRSIIVMNEIFTSTTLSDALFLGRELLKRILELDLLCVCVTFIDELASLSNKTVSVVSTVVPDNPAVRTYKIVRRPADGLAYAMSIAEKYRVTYDCLRERLSP